MAPRNTTQLNVKAMGKRTMRVLHCNACEPLNAQKVLGNYSTYLKPIFVGHHVNDV